MALLHSALPDPLPRGNSPVPVGGPGDGARRLARSSVATMQRPDDPVSPKSAVSGSSAMASGGTASDTPPHERMTREQLLVTVAVMAGIAVAALDATVVATALPTIVGELRGLTGYGWVFSGYLLAATTTVPMFAKLADMHGRRPVFLVGIGLFVGGSVLCGLSGSIGQLIAFRAVQGLGAGALQPIATTIIGDIFHPVQRARIHGLFASVWGVSAVIGPALGGLLTDTVGWRWVFYVNVPVGAVATWLLVRNFHEQVETRHHRLDWAGTLTLSGGIALLLLAVSEVGATVGWTSPLFVALLGVAIALLMSFLRIERRAIEPVIDLALVRRPLIAASVLLQALAGVLLFGIQGYVPPMVQGVQGGRALAAGAAVATMSIGWPLASIVAGRWLVRSGSRPPILAGAGCLLLGAVMMVPIATVGLLAYTMVASAVIGMGLGFLNTAIIVTVQSSVPWEQRGVATGLVQFSRTIGGAVGVGLLGGLLAGAVGPSASDILDPVLRANLAARELESLAASLSAGLTWIYVCLATVAAVAMTVAWRVGPDVDVTGSARSPSPGATPLRPVDGAPRHTPAK